MYRNPITGENLYVDRKGYSSAKRAERLRLLPPRSSAPITREGDASQVSITDSPEKPSRKLLSRHWNSTEFSVGILPHLLNNEQAKSRGGRRMISRIPTR